MGAISLYLILNLMLLIGFYLAIKLFIQFRLISHDFNLLLEVEAMF